MPVSDTDIINMALVRLGSPPINSANASSNQGIAAKTLYTPARDGLLREVPWNFARKQVVLNMLSALPINLDILPNPDGAGTIQYTGAYALPLDFLRMHRFSPQEAHWRLISFPTTTDPTPGFRLAVVTDAIPGPFSSPLFGTQPQNADGTDDLPGGIAFNTTTTQLGCEYIARVTDPNQFDSLFVECLAAKLASQLAQAVTGTAAIVQQTMQVYKELMADAAYANGAENWPDQVYDLAVVDVRYGYTGSFTIV